MSSELARSRSWSEPERMPNSDGSRTEGTRAVVLLQARGLVGRSASRLSHRVRLDAKMPGARPAICADRTPRGGPMFKATWLGIPGPSPATCAAGCAPRTSAGATGRPPTGPLASDWPSSPPSPARPNGSSSTWSPKERLDRIAATAQSRWLRGRDRPTGRRAS